LSAPGKAAILYGPRRAGKTTLLTSYLQNCGLLYRLETGDNIRIQHLLGSADLQEILARSGLSALRSWPVPIC